MSNTTKTPPPSQGSGRAKRAGVVYTCGEHTRGNVDPTQALYGRKVHTLAGGAASLLALADDGIYSIITGELLSCLDFRSAAAGKNVSIGITQSGSLYSWGIGELGELGQGPVRTHATEPAFIPHSCLFVSASAGASHAAAVDERGNGYSWGQNFEAQVGR